MSGFELFSQEIKSQEKLRAFFYSTVLILELYACLYYHVNRTTWVCANNVVIYRLGELLNKYHIKMIYISPHAGASITRLKVQRLEFFLRRISLIKMSAPSFTGSRKSYPTSIQQKLFPCILLVCEATTERPNGLSIHPAAELCSLTQQASECVTE